MTKEEIEKQIGIPISELADICNCENPDRLVTILSLAMNIAQGRGETRIHSWYAKLLRGQDEAI